MSKNLKNHNIYTRTVIDENNCPILGLLYRGYPVKDFLKLEKLEGNSLIKEAQIDEILNHCLNIEEKTMVKNIILPISLRASENKYNGRFLVVKFSDNKEANEFYDDIDKAAGSEFHSDYGPNRTIQILNLEPVQVTEENKLPLEKFMNYIFVDMNKKIVPRIRY